MLGLAQTLMAPVLLRARMEARKAAFIGAAGVLFAGALSLAGAAGLIVVSARFGVVAGLLGGAGLLLVLATFAYLWGRRSPGAAATPAQVQAEAIHEAAPVGGLASQGATMPAGMAAPVGAPGQQADVAAGMIGRFLPASFGGALPTGSEAAIAGLAARQLARRPVPTLVAAVGIGAVLGVLKFREARADDAALEIATGPSDIEGPTQETPDRPSGRRARFRAAARTAAAARRRRSV